jgi:hypothetical protein
MDLQEQVVQMVVVVLQEQTGVVVLQEQTVVVDLQDLQV